MADGTMFTKIVRRKSFKQSAALTTYRSKSAIFPINSSKIGTNNLRINLDSTYFVIFQIVLIAWNLILGSGSLKH